MSRKTVLSSSSHDREWDKHWRQEVQPAPHLLLGESKGRGGRDQTQTEFSTILRGFETPLRNVWANVLWDALAMFACADYPAARPDFHTPSPVLFQPSEQWISWLQRNRRKRRKGIGEINGVSPIPSSSSSRWKGQRQMDAVKLLSAWNTMFSWGNWSRSVTTLFSDRNTAICACETDEWGEKE